MIEELDRHQIEKILKNTTGRDPIPRYDDEKRWRETTGNPMLGFSLPRFRERLDELLQQPLTLIPASLYLNYRRTGSRTPHDGIVGGRRSRLTSFVMGECIQRRGRLMDAIMDHAWAICEESSWVIPAHSHTTLPKYSDISWIDLVSASTALTLAEAFYILGDRMDEHDPMIGERIIYEIERRCWNPYLESDDFWWLFAADRPRVNNWTAVCNCGVVGSAILVMDDIPRLSIMMEKCLQSMNDFLRCFDPDGGCDEGPSYWNYGVVNYAWLSYLFEMRTEGRISLLNIPEMRNIAMFPLRVTLSGQNVANFSDCAPRVGFHTSLMFYLGDRLGMPQVSAFAQHQYDLSPKGFGSWNVSDLVWMPKKPQPGRWERERHVYFSGQQWMISRIDAKDDKGLILAAKGGNNGENHNQNDVGNFIVHYGGEALIIDLGSGTYTKDYFAEGRYEMLVNSSWGHNVPLVNGLQQGTGTEYAAGLLEHRSSKEEDMLSMELRDAYPRKAGLENLRRRMSLNRGRDCGWIEIEDRIIFHDKTGTCKCPLYTYGNPSKVGEGEIRIAGELAGIKILYDPEEMKPVIEEEDLKDQKFTKPVRRIVFDVPIRDGSGHLHLRFSGIS